MKRKTLILSSVVFLLFFIALFFMPYIIFKTADKIIREENKKIDSYNPPGEEFYKACRLLDFTSYFPGFRNKSKDILIYYSTAIYGIYFSECLQIKYNAQQAGKDYYYEEFDKLTEKKWEEGTMTQELYEELYQANNKKIDMVDKIEWIDFIDIEETRNFCNLWTDFLTNISFKEDDICEVCCIPL